MILDAKIDQQAGTLTLVLKLQEPTPSASGKTLVVASTHGNVPAGVKVDGHDVIVGERLHQEVDAPVRRALVVAILARHGVEASTEKP
jgi:hypothetical protein